MGRFSPLGAVGSGWLQTQAGVGYTPGIFSWHPRGLETYLKNPRTLRFCSHHGSPGADALGLNPAPAGSQISGTRFTSWPCGGLSATLHPSPIWASLHIGPFSLLFVLKQRLQAPAEIMASACQAHGERPALSRQPQHN